MNVTARIHNGSTTISVNMCGQKTPNMSQIDLVYIYNSDTHKELLGILKGSDTDKGSYSISGCIMDIRLSHFRPNDVGNYMCKLIDINGSTLDSGELS